MAPRLRVFLADLGDLLWSKAGGQFHEGWPQPSMNERYPPVDEATDQDLLGFADLGENVVDGVGARMRPPIAAYDLASDCVNEAGNGTFGRYENNTVCLDKRERGGDGLGCGHGA
jgi:hypothetical protein